MKNLQKIVQQSEFSQGDIVVMLSNHSQEEDNFLFEYANRKTEEIIGNKIFLRGIIEFSNICRKNCYYCGLRCDNKNIYRYCIPHKEIVDLALQIYRHGFRSIVLQSGECCSTKQVDLICGVMQEIQEKIYPDKMSITLSMGELSSTDYRKLFDAGANRYLLRIETSNRALYSKLHPPSHSFENRINCLQKLQTIGYQTGTGVMIGLPEQTIEDLANDTLFFKERDIDMIGMGPYIPTQNTPLDNKKCPNNLQRYRLALRMIAVTRIVCKDVNIAATTALQLLHPKGQIEAIQAGANVYMPIFTPSKYKDYYTIYNNKENTDNFKIKNLINIQNATNKKCELTKTGDSLHFINKQLV